MDKVVHAIFYAILAFLIFVPVKPSRFEAATFTRLSIVILIVYGASLELLQYFVPNRTFDLIDIVANSLGILAGILLARIFRK